MEIGEPDKERPKSVSPARMRSISRYTFSQSLLQSFTVIVEFRIIGIGAKAIQNPNTAISDNELKLALMYLERNNTGLRCSGMFVDVAVQLHQRGSELCGNIS